MLGYLLSYLVPIALGVGSYLLGERTRSWWSVAAIAVVGVALAVALEAAGQSDDCAGQADSVSCGIEDLLGVVIGVVTVVCAGLAAVGVRSGRARRRA